MPKPPDLPKRPQRPASKPDLLLDLQPERDATRHHPGVDGAVQPVPRKLTAPGGFAIPQAPTVPAENPLRKQTWRIPTPPSAVALARRSDPPTSKDEAPAEDAAEAQLGALLAENARLRSDKAQLERDARAAAEARQETYPPRVEQRPQRSPSPVPSSSPEAKVDKAIGAGVRVLLSKAAPYLLAAAGIGGGITAVAKPSTDPAKTDAMAANVEAMRADVSLIREQLAGVLKREAARDAYIRCLEESLDDVGSQVLPAQDRAGAAQPLRAYVSRCQRLRP